MSVESELQEQLDFLRRPDVTWVQRGPQNPGEACMVARRSALNVEMGLTYAACVWLFHWSVDSFGENVVTWNDRNATGRDEVVERLEKAVAAAGKQGV